MNLEQKFGLFVSYTSRKGKAMYVGDLAWTLGREKYITDLGKQDEERKLNLVNEYISNKHYLIHSISDDTFKYSNSTPKGKKFDYVFIDLFHNQHSYFHRSKRIRKFEIDHFNLISNNGFALVVSKQDEFSSDEIKKLMKEKGYFLNAVLGLPLTKPRYRGLVKDQSIFFISRQKTDNLFIADLSTHQPNDSGWRLIVSNLMSNKSGSNLDEGIYVKTDNFYTFSSVKALKRVESLSSYYDEFEEKEMKKILVSIEEAIDAHDDKKSINNGIFMLKNLNDIELLVATTDKGYVESVKFWPYYYVKFSKEVNAEYIAIFLQSHIGRALVKGITNIVNRSNTLDSKSIKEIPIFFPKVDTQNRIINAHNKVLGLQDSIDEFRKNLSLNPSKFINESIDKIDDMLDLAGKLNETDKVRQLIERGECSSIEFKQTYCLETDPKHPQYKKSNNVLKERIFEQISALLNSYGGVLLIGVHDEQYVTGMEEELKSLYGNSMDRFKLRFYEDVIKYIGTTFTSSDYITYDFVHIDSHEVFRITCNRSAIPCRFGKDERLIVRADPRVRVLKGEEEVRYISKHFPKYFTSLM